MDINIAQRQFGKYLIHLTITIQTLICPSNSVKYLSNIYFSAKHTRQVHFFLQQSSLCLLMYPIISACQIKATQQTKNFMQMTWRTLF